MECFNIGGQGWAAFHMKPVSVEVLEPRNHADSITRKCLTLGR